MLYSCGLLVSYIGDKLYKASMVFNEAMPSGRSSHPLAFALERDIDQWLARAARP
jgi:hypothetical protein